MDPGDVICLLFICDPSKPCPDPLLLRNHLAKVCYAYNDYTPVDGIAYIRRCILLGNLCILHTGEVPSPNAICCEYTHDCLAAAALSPRCADLEFDRLRGSTQVSPALGFGLSVLVGQRTEFLRHRSSNRTPTPNDPSSLTPTPMIPANLLVLLPWF
jgi:hypothetical protein